MKLSPPSRPDPPLGLKRMDWRRDPPKGLISMENDFRILMSFLSPLRVDEDGLWMYESVIRNLNVFECVLVCKIIDTNLFVYTDFWFQFSSCECCAHVLLLGRNGAWNNIFDDNIFDDNIMIGQNTRIIMILIVWWFFRFVSCLLSIFSKCLENG